MGKKKIIGYLVLGVMLFVLAVSLQGCAGAEEDGQEGTNDYLTALDMETDISAIYTLEYQEDIEKQIEALKEENSYTLEDPLVIADPYGTNTTGLYVFFTSDTAAKASYTVSADGYEPFGEELYGDYTTEHEYLLIGMIPDTVNTITLTLQDEEGETAGTLELEYDAPSLAGSEENTQLEVKEGESGKELSDGLYTMLGNRTDEDNEETDFILLYDNYGTLRTEIPIKSYRACNILFGDDEIYFSASANELVAMDRLGRITEIYTLGDYQLHHDYIFGSREDFLVLATEEGKDTEEDRILSVDMESGEVTEIIDLADLFGDYLNTLDMENGDEEPFDWIHINSIRLIDDDSIIISSRETSTIIKIEDIYTEPEVSYLIGSSQFWEESGYDDLVLEQEGEFSLNAGQHCVEYEESEELKEGQYYLYFYNNNNAVSSTRDYDYSEDEGYNGTYSGTDGVISYYDKYLVDEEAGTFALEERIPVTYSGYVSSVQQVGGNLLVDSGSAFTAVEFDQNFDEIQTLVGTGDTWWYRVFKYDYKGFWFN